MMNQRYYIIESDTYHFIRIHAELLNQHTFFTIYARVFSEEQIRSENIQVINFSKGEQLDEEKLGKGKWAIVTMDVFSLEALECHYKKWYPNLMKCEEQRNEYIALQRSKNTVRAGQQLQMEF